MSDVPQQSPPRPLSMDSSGASDFLGSPVALAASAASAASMTSSPGISSRPAPGRDRDEGEWSENALVNKEESLTSKQVSILEASSDLESLQQLTRQGCWRSIADKMRDARRRSSSRPPDEKFVYCTYHVLALMKLRNYAAAQDVLLALGDLNSPNSRFEQYPDYYPNKSGSMVPFGLRWLQAELPHRVGQTSTTIDRLYDLLAHCNERIDFLHTFVNTLSRVDDGVPQVQPDTSARRSHRETSGLSVQEEEGSSPFQGDFKERSAGGLPEPPEEGASSKLEDVGSNYVSSGALDDNDFGEFVTSAFNNDSGGNIVHATLVQQWTRRQEVVLCSVLSHHLDQKDYVTCLKWLENLVKKRVHDVVVLSKYGYVQLQLGDLYGARRTFATVEAICEQQGKSSSTAPASLLSRNRGLLYFSLKQYGKAVKEFEAVLESDPSDVVSANNKALCLMYSRDLVGATQVLETMLQASPITALNEALVLNLCSMYELASMNSIESKKTLSSWILRIAPDDFDLTCTRL